MGRGLAIIAQSCGSFVGSSSYRL